MKFIYTLMLPFLYYLNCTKLIFLSNLLGFNVISARVVILPIRVSS